MSNTYFSYMPKGGGNINNYSSRFNFLWYYPIQWSYIKMAQISQIQTRRSSIHPAGG
jgi:hypothetical protein